MPKQPRIPIVVTAATASVLKSPLFPQVLEHWREIVSKIVVVIPQACDVPRIQKVRFVQVSRNTPSLGDVVMEVVRAIDAMQKTAAVVDPFTVFKWDVFQMFTIAEQRQLSLSWMATSHPVRLLNFDTPTVLDESMLTFFCAQESIWSFLANRNLPEHVPFISPAWSGWLASWASKHVHAHKYHDISDLRAVGILEDAPIEAVSLDGLGMLTFNPPARNYVTKIQ